MEEQNLDLGATSKVVTAMWKRLDNQTKTVRILNVWFLNDARIPLL